MNWLDHHPDDLIERFEPAEALALLRQQATLTPNHAGKLDVFLHHWTLVLLQRVNDPEGVQEVLTLCEIAQDLAPDGAEGSPMRQRWNGFEDLLEGKRRYLNVNAGQTAAPIQLKHESAILEFIQQSEGRCAKQLDLAEHLKLSKGRVSQILGVLESRSLVTRKRQGKESWISLGGADGSSNKPPEATSSPAEQHLGAQVFAYRKAA